MPSRRILYTVLNWGLGHATRSIPIIQELQSRGHEIILASDGRAGSLLQKEFPNLSYRELPGYRADYRYPIPIRYARLVYRTWRAIRAERSMVEKWLSAEPCDFVISDNRYGTYHSKVKNIIISHQLNLPVVGVLQPLARKAIKDFLGNFDACWVPDVERSNNLSGSLSINHSDTPVVYIGWLSRLKKLRINKRYDYAIILSGPEPHRTQLEQEIRKQLEHTPTKAVMVLGKTDVDQKQRRDQVVTYSSLTSSHLNEMICTSRVLVSRAGYSTMMDSLSLDQPAILIPTPGQPEQQYLAKRHASHPLWVIQKQGQVALKEGLSTLQARASYRSPLEVSGEMLREAISGIGL